MDVGVVVDNVTGGPSDSFPSSVPILLYRHPHVLAPAFTEPPHVLRQVMLAPKNHQTERATLQQVLHDGIVPGQYLLRIKPDLSIGSDRVGRVERLLVLQGKNVFDLAADEQTPGRPNSTN